MQALLLIDGVSERALLLERTRSTAALHAATATALGPYRVRSLKSEERDQVLGLGLRANPHVRDPTERGGSAC